jgi:anti-sigma-K factor RskA
MEAKAKTFAIPVDCKDRTEQILLYAAGALSHAEAEPVRAHLASGCPRCAGELAEAEATISLLALTLPPATPADNVRQRLLNRIDSQGRQIPLPENTPRRAATRAVGGPPWWALFLGSAALAAAVAAGLAIFFTSRLHDADMAILSANLDQKQQLAELSDLAGQENHQILSAAKGAADKQQLAALSALVQQQNQQLASIASDTDTKKQIADLTSRIDRQNRQLAALTGENDQEKTIAELTALVEQQKNQMVALRSGGAPETVQWATQPDLRVFSMTGAGDQPPGAHGRIFWDANLGVWHFFASGLKPAPEGKTYELWFVSKDGKTAVPAGTFDPSPNGEAALVTKVPPSISNSLAIGAVTDEPTGGVSAPTGSFQLKGSVQ